MSKYTTLVLALAVGQSVAAPSGQPFMGLEKRQGGFGAFGSLFGGSSCKMDQLIAAKAKNTLGQFMGEEIATEQLTCLATTLGANRNSPGNVGMYTAKVLNRGWGAVAAPAGAVAAREVMKPRVATPGAQTIKLRYGPYKVPSVLTKNELGEEGMLSNFPDTNLPKPCEGECTILGMSAGLEYLDGKNANIDTGLWLHHMVLFNVGTGRQDPTCAERNVSLPHATIGATPRNSERIFASGNERSVADFPAWGVTDAGMKIKSDDKFAALVEIMNETKEDKVMFMTMTYDVLPGHPYKDDVRVLWFDVRQCGTSEINPPMEKSKFVFDYKWTASIEGEIIGAIGHMHDGGDHTTLAVDGKATCDNVAKYGTKPEFVQKPVEGGHGHGATVHISDMNTCYGKSFPEPMMKKGQVWDFKAHYDLDKQKGAAHGDMSLDAVMGIEIIFVRTKAT